MCPPSFMGLDRSYCIGDSELEIGGVGLGYRARPRDQTFNQERGAETKGISHLLWSSSPAMTLSSLSPLTRLSFAISSNEEILDVDELDSLNVEYINYQRYQSREKLLKTIDEIASRYEAEAKDEDEDDVVDLEDLQIVSDAQLDDKPSDPSNLPQINLDTAASKIKHQSFPRSPNQDFPHHDQSTQASPNQSIDNTRLDDDKCVNQPSNHFEVSPVILPSSRPSVVSPNRASGQHCPASPTSSNSDPMALLPRSTETVDKVLLERWTRRLEQKSDEIIQHGLRKQLLGHSKENSKPPITLTNSCSMFGNLPHTKPSSQPTPSHCLPLITTMKSTIIRPTFHLGPSNLASSSKFYTPTRTSKKNSSSHPSSLQQCINNSSGIKRAKEASPSPPSHASTDSQICSLISSRNTELSASYSPHFKPTFLFGKATPASFATRISSSKFVSSKKITNNESSDESSDDPLSFPSSSTKKGSIKSQAKPYHQFNQDKSFSSPSPTRFKRRKINSLENIQK
ncbi:hypothetical protein O181_057290 [Austropuccinia psidii MF-1]|uniref:Uncharacterized protein n=1 Tax=Austropuccinia psidii MF-1 TaxID=1389203 RepID=A0A9Q3E7P2_9BASI|nr:hypothetical protein [Austropuccinia psidii MF-1]